jgi:hypothetical protein
VSRSSRRSDSLNATIPAFDAAYVLAPRHVGVADDRAVVDDRAAPADEHPRQGTLGEVGDAHEVDLHERVDLAHVLLLEQPRREPPGVVDEEVHRAVAGRGGTIGSKRSGARTPARMRCSGFAASASTIARPIPRLAPVTSAVVPVRSMARVRRRGARRSVIVAPARLVPRVMTAPRSLAVAVLGLRVAYGVALIAAPTRLTRRWLGPAAAQEPTQVALRGLGAREVLLHAAGLAATLRGDAVRPWLAASVAGDLSDIAATAAGRRGLPGGSAAATLAVAGGSALLSAAVGAALDG